MEIKIYLSNLSKYIEGKENGRWLQLPMESDRLNDIFDEIVGKNQESIILDYNAPFEISEYENIFTLNEFIENLSNCEIEEEEVKVLFEISDCKEEVLNAIENDTYRIINVDYVTEDWCTGIDYETLLGMVLNEEGYNNLFSQPIPEEMIDYIDFEQIYICLSVNDGWKAVNIGNVTYLATLNFK